MNAKATGTPENWRNISKRQRVKYLLRVKELPLFLGLIILWMMLWQEISLLTALSGALLALVLMRVFYLPPVELAGRFHPLWAVRYLCYLFWQMGRASLSVAWRAVRPAPEVEPAILAVPLRTRSDFLMTLTSLTVSLIPGSLIVDVDRYGSVLYIHVLDAPTEAMLTKARDEVFYIERLLILSIGSSNEVEQVK